MAVSHIIITSDEPWSEVWHTQLNYAHQLSKRFHVIFLGPPSPWKVSHLWSWKQNHRVIGQTLEVISYVNLLPAILGTFALRVNDWFNTQLIRKKLNFNPADTRMIIWHFDRYRAIRLFSASKDFRHIYHVIDAAINLNLDVELSEMADLVVVTSPKFIDHYRNLNSNVLQLGQGVDLDLYTGCSKKASIESLVSYDSIMLLGTLNDSIDYGILEKIALKLPYRLCLIGPDKIIDPGIHKIFERLLSHPDVHWLGAMPPAEFCVHLYACRVGLIAYDLTGSNNNDLRSPLKVISYLACGKCAISNIDCEIPDLENRAVYYCRNENDFEKLIVASFSGKLLLDQNAVKNYLEKISYDSLLEIIFHHLDENLPAKPA